MKLDRTGRIVAGLSLAALLAAPAFAKDNKPAAKPATTTAAKHEAIDINSCSQADLAALPGVGDAYAQKIVAGRPYKEKSDLLHKKIVPASVYSKIKNDIVAKQS
jgi:DNA uptake protein ComE-like DNA-binding protein